MEAYVNIGKIRKKELSSNYYASTEDIGKYRVDVVKNSLQKLNGSVKVLIDKNKLCENHFKIKFR